MITYVNYEDLSDEDLEAMARASELAAQAAWSFETDKALRREAETAAVARGHLFKRRARGY